MRARFARASLLCLLATTTAAARQAGAVETRFWSVASRADVEKGEIDGVAVDADGVITLAPGKREVAQASEVYFWRTITRPGGSFYVGTGDSGKILAIDGSDVRLLCDLDLLEVTALVRAPNGTVFAAGAPGGTVFAIDANGKASPYFQTEQGVVWDLAISKEGGLLVATGESGKLFLVSGAERGKLLFEGTEPHIMSVASLPDGGVVFGTAGDGLVYRLDASGTASVLYDAAEEEIRAVLRAEDGTIYVAANVAPPGEAATGEDQPRPAIYRLGGYGAAVRVWTAPSSFIFDLESDAPGTLLAATGEKAGLYRIDVARMEGSRIAQFEETSALSIVRSGRELLVSTGDPGRLYALGPSLRAKGQATSEAHDAGAEAQWSRLRWMGKRPAGTSVGFETRVGNRKTPDMTWSSWLRAEPDGEDAAIIRSPQGRFLQWRAILEGGESSTPAVSRVTTSYREVNLPPLVSAIVVTRQGEDLLAQGDPRPRAVRRQLPSGISVDYSLPNDPVQGPSGVTEAGWAVGLRSVSWLATDPNGDPLTFTLSYRPVESTRWLPLAKDVKELVYTWDASAFPDGDYQLRVEASDVDGNGEGLGLGAEVVSEAFHVDNTPPRVTKLEARLEQGRLRVLAGARDDRSAIIRADVSVDGQEWRPAPTTTGLLDARSVELEVWMSATDRQKGDPIVLRVFDEAGNKVVARAFLE